MNCTHRADETIGRSIATNREAVQPAVPRRLTGRAGGLSDAAISKRTLQNYRDRRVLPYSNVGGKFFYRKTDVVGFLQARRSGKGV